MKILFVLHDTTLSGATITLLRYIAWLKNNSDCETHFLLPYHSQFDEYFESIGKVIYWLKEIKTPFSPFLYFFNTRKNRSNDSIDWKNKLIRVLSKENYDIIYGNTIVVVDTLNYLRILNKPIVWHIHENELSVKIYNENALKYYDLAKRIIATSHFTYDFLVNKWNIPPTLVKIHVPPISKNAVYQNLIEFPKNSFIIGTSGTGLMQKGMEIFIILAKILETRFENSNFYYVWIGSDLTDPNIRFDLEQTKLISKFCFAGPIKNPYDYFRKFDLFISCSREESFGLAIAECASLGIPFVCFPTNGLLWYFENRNDFCVDYLDLNKMADRIIDLYTNKAKRIKLGQIAGEVCRKFYMNNLGPDWYNTLQDVVNSKLFH